jgi:hypothetical protein
MKMYFAQWRQGGDNSFAASDFPRQDILDKVDLIGGPYAVIKTGVDVASLELDESTFGLIPEAEQAAVLEQLNVPADYTPPEAE